MGNLSQKTAKQSRETVFLMFYDGIFQRYDDTLAALRELTLHGETPYEGSRTSVERAGTRFDFMWGSGLGRCTMRPVAQGLLSETGAFILIVSHEFVSGEYQDLSKSHLQSQLSHPGIGDQVKVLLMITFPEQETFPSKKETVYDVRNMLQGWVKNYEVIPCSQNRAETIKTAMDNAGQWIAEQKALKKSQKHLEELKKAPIFLPKLMSLTKSLPKKQPKTLSKKQIKTLPTKQRQGVY